MLESTRTRNAKALFDQHLQTIRNVLERAAVRRLPQREIEDFVSWGLLRMIESRYRCLGLMIYLINSMVRVCSLRSIFDRDRIR